MNNNQNNLIKLSQRLKELESKKLKLILVGDLRYTTNNLKVLNQDSISFTDLRGDNIVCSISQVLMVTEVRDG